MNHIGLFEGVGGFSLAARWMGWETVAWCECDEFCQRVLKYHFPNAEAHGDITTTDFTRYAGQIDILTGGFPCQPYSSAGKRLGKEDDRHLWPEMCRAIREIQPRWVVGENVRGLTNWNGGLVFDEVQADLENEGYEVTPYLLPACAVNAPHRRDRIWFVAYRTEQPNEQRESKVGGVWNEPDAQRNVAANANGYGYELRGFGEDRCASIEGESKQNKRERVWGYDRGVGQSWDATNTTQAERKQPSGTWPGREGLADLCPGQFATNTNQERLQRGAEFRGIGGSGQNGDKQPAGCFRTNWQQFPTQSPVCSRNDGISDGLVGITFSKHREKSIGAYGNAIVPQVALMIFKAIQEYENLNNT